MSGSFSLSIFPIWQRIEVTLENLFQSSHSTEQKIVKSTSNGGFQNLQVTDPRITSNI